MDLSAYQLSDRITVARPPEDVYAIVADVSRMGELSPVATGGSYDDPAAGAVEGGWFTGSNAIGEFTWDTRCRVEVAKPGVEFTFTNCGPDGSSDLVRWSYSFEAADGGTEVTESWQVLPPYVDFTRAGNPDMSDDDVKARIDGMAAMARDGMAATLAKLKEIAEA